MKTVPSNLSVSVKRITDHEGVVTVMLRVEDSLGRAVVGRFFNYNPTTRKWFCAGDGHWVEVTQEYVYNSLINAYRTLSVENLIADNLTATEEGF